MYVALTYNTNTYFQKKKRHQQQRGRAGPGARAGVKHVSAHGGVRVTPHVTMLLLLRTLLTMI